VWSKVMNTLTLSLPIPLTLYTVPYWSNPRFLIVDIWALWRSVLSARAPDCQKLKIMGLTSVVLDPLNSNSLEQLALKGLMIIDHMFHSFSYRLHQDRINLRSWAQFYR